MPYTPQNFTRILGTEGFSDTMLQNHFKLYEGYVTNVNKLSDLLKTTNPTTPMYAELKRRFGWEFDGMKLHELYFDNMSATPKTLGSSTALEKKIVENFSSHETWEKDFVATSTMRGIGWAILYYEPEAGRLFNTWVNEHDMGHLVGCTPLLVLDCFEHAFTIDYGINRAAYIATFLKALDWKIVEQRF